MTAHLAAERIADIASGTDLLTSEELQHVEHCTDCLDAVAELIRETAASFDVPIEVEVPDDVPTIEADPVRIREVLLNLLTNALQHGGSAAIDARSNSQNVVIRVIDKGKGIPADELPRILDRFTKAPASRGSGLGLAISRNLVLAHGGTIEATSRVGEGTTITITLPR